jgi:HEAT repeat protein
MENIMNCWPKRAFVEAAILASLEMMCAAQASSPFAGAEPRDIIRTLKFLRSPDYVAAVPVIVPLLKHENANVVRDACRTLTVIGDNTAIPAIEPLLSDNRTDVRREAKEAIDLLRSDHRPQYHQSPLTLASLPSSDIIQTLKMLRSPEFSAAAPAVLPLLHHTSAKLICEACRTLGIIANKEAIPSIEPLLNDKRADVRKDAQDAIDKLRAKP